MRGFRHWGWISHRCVMNAGEMRKDLTHHTLLVLSRKLKLLQRPGVRQGQDQVEIWICNRCRLCRYTDVNIYRYTCSINAIIRMQYNILYCSCLFLGGLTFPCRALQTPTGGNKSPLKCYWHEIRCFRVFPTRPSVLQTPIVYLEKNTWGKTAWEIFLFCTLSVFLMTHPVLVSCSSSKNTL